MQLPLDQTERFYRIWFPLLQYVNNQLQLVPSFPLTPMEESINPTDALQLRNALWADDSLRETFIATNPAGLPPADLALVESWQHRLAGNFFIFRYLKKYTVLLSEHAPMHAYGVLGLVSPIEEVIGPTLPVYARAVLLPFEDKITYDGLLQPYNIFFGPGIRGDLNETYRNIQEREGIITTLVPPNAPGLDEVRNEVRARNAKILGAFRKDLARRGLSSKMVEQHAGNIETFAQMSLLAQDPPRGLLTTTLADVQTYLSTAGNKTNPTSFKRFVRFLLETDRMKYDQAELLQDFLKHAGEES